MRVWINHESNERPPVPRGLRVDVMRFNGEVDFDFPAGGWNWNQIGIYGPINTAIAAWRISEHQPSIKHR